MRDSSLSTRPIWETQDNSSQDSSINTASSSRNSLLPQHNSQSTTTSFDQTPVSSLGRDQPLAERWSQQNFQKHAVLQRPRTPSNDKDDDLALSGGRTPTSSASTSPLKGAKRMANGAIKTVKLSTRENDSSPRSRGHARNTSLDSAFSNVGQLSDHLKVRLSYALVKVQNGWESRSIDEVENLAYRLTSPITNNVPGHSEHLHSPRSDASIVYAQSRGLTNSTVSPSRPSTSYAAWNAQVASSYPEGKGVDQRVPLAPAPDLYPQQRSRRSHGHGHRPRLSTVSAAHLYTPGTTTPTPQEQDAVDTLLFMSSPANSANYKRPVQSTRAAQSPRTRDLTLGSQRELQKVTQATGSTTLLTQASSQHEQDVDMLLDEMREYGSNGDESRGGRRDALNQDDIPTNAAAPNAKVRSPVSVRM
ncbi:MAG: hypothetical protein M1828_002350 [Chrysothrix sp. TS-e1954]|nr:MAG: hypothetical protein M1828_002350 [Chrysothrix sp. TS-e1954]